MQALGDSPLSSHNMSTQRARRKKFIVHFDEESRKKYLTGFQKRKRQRKKKALEKQQQQVAEKKKQIKSERKAKIKDAMKKFGLLSEEPPTQEDGEDTLSECTTGVHQECANKWDSGQGSISLKNQVQQFKETKGHIITVSTIPQLDTSSNWTELITSTNGHLEL